MMRLLLLLAFFAAFGSALPSNSFAHSFNVTLILPTTERAKAVNQGFMLATTEMDGHADEESDGHLGGLDVYVSRIETSQDPDKELRRIAASQAIDIVVVFDPESQLAAVKGATAPDTTTLLLPGEPKYTTDAALSGTWFLDNFEKTYGKKPSAGAVQGYNAARRIAAAIRAQEGVDDRKQMRQNFAQTSRDFKW